MKAHGGPCEPGTWSIGFFATQAENHSRGRIEIRLPAARWFEASASLDRDEAIEKLKKAAEKAGYQKIEIFSVSRILRRISSD